MNLKSYTKPQKKLIENLSKGAEAGLKREIEIGRGLGIRKINFPIKLKRR